MSDPFSLFGDENPPAVEGPRPMSDAQRRVLRGLFGQLGLTTAREQFDVVEELTGRRLRSVGELDERGAGALIILVRHRATSVAQPDTGNEWADRQEETWIDKL